VDPAPVTARATSSVGSRAPFDLGDLPSSATMATVDEAIVRAPIERIFAIAADVERWPQRLAHYRYVTLRDRRRDGGGLVEMSANRPFGALRWPTWWESEMVVRVPRGGVDDRPAIRFRHVRGITTGMEVEWQFVRLAETATRVRIVHLWNGPRWPLIGTIAARAVIGPVFVHGIASRTLAGLARAAEENG
jgi:ribosome-associated toxin RatA of RatAB toxin-antitoxin module